MIGVTWVRCLAEYNGFGDELPSEHYLLDSFPHYTCIMRDIVGGYGDSDDLYDVVLTWQQTCWRQMNITGKTGTSKKQ